MQPSWNTPHTALEGRGHARSEVRPAPALARRVALVIVDGLSFDHARRMPELAALREEGALRMLTAHEPTFTGPNITAMMTGLAPRESGVRLNGPGAGTNGLDDVAHAAWDAGVFVRVRSRTYAPFDRLTRPPPQADVARGRARPLFDWELERMRPPSAEPGTATGLDLVYFGDVDDAGHRFGAASDAYAKAAVRAAAFLERVASTLDPQRDLLLVASDHGHLPGGGHGGAEAPVRRAMLLAWGGPVRRGVELEPRPIRDLASTIAIAVGAHAPSSNQGSPMIDLFDLDERAAAEHVLEPFDQATSFLCGGEEASACAHVEHARGELERGYGARDAVDLVGEIARERDRASDEAEIRALRRRLGGGLVVAAALLALSRVGGFARPTPRPAAALAVAVGATYGGALAALGYRLTLSAMRPAPDFARDAAIASLLAVGAGVAAASRVRPALSDLLFLALAPFFAFVPIAAAAGADPRALPHPLASVLELLGAPLVCACGATSVVLALVREVKLVREVRLRS